MSEQKKEDDSISLSLNPETLLALKGLLNLKTISFLLLILIPILITVSVRLQPVELKITEDWARNSVTSSIMKNVETTINAQYPTLPLDKRQVLVNQEYDRTIIEQKAEMDNQIKEVSTYFKTAFQYTENNITYTYLGDLDSYYYLRQARNLLSKGTICDKIDNNKCIDDHMMAPEGVQLEATLHPYAIVYTYKILHFFNSKINLMYASFYLPTLVAIFVSILSFLVARRIAGNVGGFFASILISTNQLFLSRTLGSDTDIWNLFFPLLIFFLFVETVEAKKTLRLIYAGLTGLAFGIYSFAWGAWWFTFDLVILSYLLYLLYYISQNVVGSRLELKKFLADQKLREDLLTMVVLVLSSALFVSIISTPAIFLSSPFQPFSLNRIDEAAHTTIWPNVYTTVAELNNSSLNEVVSSTGGKVIFFLILMGIVLALIKNQIKTREIALLGLSVLIYLFMLQDSSLAMNIMLYLFILALPFLGILYSVYKDKTVEIKYSLLLLLWIAASLYAALKGMRFILLLIPVAGISFGVAMGKLHHVLTSIMSRKLSTPKPVVALVFFFVLCYLIVAPVNISYASDGGFLPSIRALPNSFFMVRTLRTAYATGRGFLPSISSTWADSLTNIRDNSAKDAIINSWWDFGHWFKYFADRRVTFDGASQNVPHAHWIGKALLSSDEHVSMGILRMLDCDSNNAFYRLYDITNNDSLKSIELLNKIIIVERDEAKKILGESGLNDDQAELILNSTHCNPPEDYFITSDDMIGKSGVWAHFGSWDFIKAYIYTHTINRNTEEAISIIMKLNYSRQEAATLYNTVQTFKTQREVNDWISPWPGYTTAEWRACQKTEESLVCGYNMGITQREGTVIVLDRAVINLTNKTNSYVMLTYVNANTGAVLDQSIAYPSSFALTEKTGIVKYQPRQGSNTLYMDILVDLDKSQSLIMDPILTDSLFTKLYFLNGRYTTHFQLFSDKKNTIVGHRIVVWKLDWTGTQQN